MLVNNRWSVYSLLFLFARQVYICGDRMLNKLLQLTRKHIKVSRSVKKFDIDLFRIKSFVLVPFHSSFDPWKCVSSLQMDSSLLVLNVPIFNLKFSAPKCKWMIEDLLMCLDIIVLYQLNIFDEPYEWCIRYFFLYIVVLCLCDYPVFQLFFLHFLSLNYISRYMNDTSKICNEKKNKSSTFW